jgi:hypothetical protein
MKSKILTAVFFIFSVFVLTSCSETQEDKVVEFVKQNMKNPKSFELESIEPIDTTFLSDFIQDSIDSNVFVLEDTKYKLDRSKSELKTIENNKNLIKDCIKRGMGADYLPTILVDEFRKEKNTISNIKDLENNVNFIENTIDSLTNLKNSLVGSPQDSIVYITYKVRAYGTNSFNATILSTYKVIVNSNGEMTIKEF